jgi:hypothetical protein
MISFLLIFSLPAFFSLFHYLPLSVPDKRSRSLEVIVVRRVINLGTGNLEWGGNGKGMGREWEGLRKGLRKGRSVYEEPETKVDEILSQQGGFPSK